MEAKLKEISNNLDVNGYAVIEDFLTENELQSVRTEYQRIVDEHVEKVKRGEAKDTAALEYDQTAATRDELVFSIEDQCLNENGELKDNYKREQSYARFGFTLHVTNNVFRNILTKDYLRQIFKSVGYEKPIIVASLIHPKYPRIGTGICFHRDSWGLYTKPFTRTLTICFMLDDTTAENGCLQFVPGSHKKLPPEDKRKIVVQQDLKNLMDTVYLGEELEFNDNEFVNVEVKKGGAILLDGDVVHRSGDNLSDKRRAVLTALCYDKAKAKIDDRSLHSNEGLALDVNENMAIKRCS